MGPPADGSYGSAGLPRRPVTVPGKRPRNSRPPSLLGRILAGQSVCLCLLCAAVVARLVTGPALAPPLDQLVLYIGLPGFAALGVGCGAAAIGLGVRRWGWIGMAANGLGLLLMGAALAIFLWLASQIRFTT